MNKINFDAERPALKEEDFYPAPDDRMHDCGICDVQGGDNFADYAEWFWDCYEDELFC